MPNLPNLAGLQDLWAKTTGNSEICIAVLDGLVDRSHPCFEGANLTQLPSLVQGEAQATGSMSTHGTHVTSVIFGQHSSEIQGVAPQCRGLIIPVFSDDRRRVSQLDLARAIEQAVSAGAHMINISGGQLTEIGEAEDWLVRAVNLCQDSNVLLVAAAGNDGCDCLHVPAALPAVLAVGATDEAGRPLDFSNWGETYQTQGILAPGANILGAKPEGGTMRLSGTSFAAPIVSGVAGLLLSLQVQRGETPDPQKVRAALLQTALPCETADTDGDRCLVGRLNISGALEFMTGKNTGETMSEELETSALETVAAAGCGCGGRSENDAPPESPPKASASAQEALEEISEPITASMPPRPTSFNTVTMSNSASNSVSHAVTASQAESGGGIVYALGTLGYDFGTEARRDTFKQLMPGVAVDSTTIPANPYDARQMVDYLAASPSEGKALIWTLNIELTPVYAIEPVGPFAREVYGVLQELLSGQIQAEDSEDYVERVSIPGRLTGRTVRLFSGQVVPVIEPENTRGMYGWKVNTLVNAAIETVRSTAGEADEGAIQRTLGSFLSRIYYDLRNLGTTSQDRALNFASTNAFQAASTFAEAVAQGMELDSITVEKSPFCRIDSDCWDVKLKFFDPENSRRAKKVFRFTIDVSDVIPVTLGEVRSWSTPY